MISIDTFIKLNPSNCQTVQLQHSQLHFYGEVTLCHMSISNLFQSNTNSSLANYDSSKYKFIYILSNFIYPSNELMSSSQLNILMQMQFSGNYLIRFSLFICSGDRYSQLQLQYHFLMDSKDVQTTYLPTELQGCKSVSLVIDIDSKYYYVFHDQQNIFMGFKHKGILEINQQWKFPKIRDIQKIVANYFYIITQDHKIGIYWFQSSSSISTYVQLHKFQSYFIHEVKKNVFEVQIFKSQLEILVFQITVNSKKTEGSFRLQSHQQGYNVLAEKKKLILAPKYLINTTRRLILSRNNSKDPFFYIKKYPDNAYFLIGLSATNQYVAFTNKIQYFDPLLSTKPKKLQHPYSYKYTRCYLRHNHLIVTPENHQYAYVIQITLEGAQVISRISSEEQWVFGMDCTEIIATFSKLMICKRISSANQFHHDEPFKKISDQLMNDLKPIKNLEKQQDCLQQRNITLQKLQNGSEIQNLLQKTLENSERQPKLVIFHDVNQSTSNKLTQIINNNKKEQTSVSELKDQQKEVNERIIKVQMIQNDYKILQRNCMGIGDVKNVNEKLKVLIQNIRQNNGNKQPDELIIRFELRMKQEVQKMLIEYVQEYLPNKMEGWMMEICQKNKEFSRAQTENWQKELGKASKKGRHSKGQLATIKSIDDYQKIKKVKYLQQNEQTNTELYYHWKTQIKEVQNAVLFIKNRYADLVARTAAKNMKINQFISTLDSLTNVLHPFTIKVRNRR